ncbi:MAG: efflux RND transporter periplasmic adaptor subunit [Bacteroidales bacterium]|nr:efflux RND transporter periplasmic adaptor subunit [Bacteroidales bacterium]
MKRFFKILMWCIVAAVFIGSFVYLYLNSQDKEEVYDLVSPSTGDIERSTVLTGKIEPRDEIDIKPQISGIISEINVEAGDMVKEGDIIAKIKVVPEASSLSSAQNRVDVAQISLDDARRQHERNTLLYEKKVISREDYEATEIAYEKAVRELEGAQDAYRIVKEGVSSLNASESNTLVRSTITGLVLDVPVKVGTSVIQANTFNDGTTIATVADMTNLIFKGTVDETEVGLLSLGKQMEITIGALPDLHPVAEIEYISPKGNESNGANTFDIKAAIHVDEATALRAGYSANAKVVLNEARGIMLVPESVVEFVGDSTYVYLLTDSLPSQAFERRAFEAGTSDGINIEVKSGIDNTARLRGAKIQ